MPVLHVPAYLVPTECWLCEGPTTEAVVVRGEQLIPACQGHTGGIERLQRLSDRVGRRAQAKKEAQATR